MRVATDLCQRCALDRPHQNPLHPNPELVLMLTAQIEFPATMRSCICGVVLAAATWRRGTRGAAET
jgi:hypothetical protein